MNFEQLIRRAQAVVAPRRLSAAAEAGSVGAALLSEGGIVYVGVCIDAACSVGFCAEHAAAAAMITAGEQRIVKMVAVGSRGEILPPCGRCREFIYQIHEDNVATKVMVQRGVVVTLLDLLPYYWRDEKRKREKITECTSN